MCALLLALMPICSAEADWQAEIDGILHFAQGEKSTAEWALSLAGNPGSAADNYILALSFMGADFDRAACAKALAEALESGAETNPVSRQRMALALIACGGAELLPEALVDETTGKLGVMSYIFGLHLLSSGAPSENWTKEAVIEKLASLKKEDGGWAVTGSYGDVDATSMCIQALSACKGEDGVQELIDGGIALLAARQKENAGFSSLGVENAESAAQAAMALVSAGINPLEDARFIRDGRTMLDAMLDYRLENGGYSHTAGSEASDMACVQALQALLSVQAMKPIYDFSEVEAITNSQGFGWKIYAWIGIGAIALLGIIFGLIKKRGRLKRVLFILLAAAIAAAGVGFVNFESTDSYYSASEVKNAAGSVYLSIRCDTVAGQARDGSTPEDGEILPRTEIAFAEGDSVFDVLTRAVKERRLHMEYAGANASQAYVKGINYLYELAYGDLSGWIYLVNGERASVGCGTYVVQDGDEIIWAYTTELGEDLK
ncbi:MAG: DUF4430 domain-containing protein [Clostridia bacterium]|nr:DUF4430 domain-containing protein [Clostridia bacterium]